MGPADLGGGDVGVGAAFGVGDGGFSAGWPPRVGSFPPRTGENHCNEHLRAGAGTPKVDQVSPGIGEYTVTWKISGGGPEIASWQYLIEEPPALLFRSNASAVFGYHTREELPDAVFPNPQQFPCPKVYDAPSGRFAV